ncbi:hypothetical protein N7465_001832 [Penicillium sp. CMV-2018d]|nr:hypothetical protein N7465_001832 [Penicillium sp. CMV-2018d]
MYTRTRLIAGRVGPIGPELPVLAGSVPVYSRLPTLPHDAERIRMESAIPSYDEKKDQNIAHLGREFDVPYHCAQTIHGRNALSYHRADPLVLLSTRCLWFSTDRRRA